MNLTHHRLFILLTVALIAISGTQADDCPSKTESSSFYNNDGLVFPSYVNPPFNVSENQQRRWILQFSGNNLYVITVQVPGTDLKINLKFSNYAIDFEERSAGLTADLYDTHTKTSYSITATGTFSPFGLRSSPDFKWATLYDIKLNGMNHL